MVSTGSGPWYNAPARPFPAKVWLRERYPFRVSPLVFARLPNRPSVLAASARRPFPALAWLEQRCNRKIGRDA